MDIITKITVFGATEGEEMIALMPGRRGRTKVAYTSGPGLDGKVDWYSFPVKTVGRNIDQDNNAVMRLIVTNPRRKSKDELTYVRHVDRDTGAVTEMLLYLGHFLHHKKGVTFDGANVVAIPDSMVLRHLAVDEANANSPVAVAVTADRWQPNNSWRLFIGPCENMPEVDVDYVQVLGDHRYLYTSLEVFDFPDGGSGQPHSMSPQWGINGPARDLKPLNPSRYKVAEIDGGVAITKK